MYQEPNQLLNKYAPIAIIVVVVGGSLALFGGDIEKQSAKVDGIRAQTERIESDRIQLDIARQRAEQLNPLLKQLNAAETERATQEEAIASQRVKTNCLWVDANGSLQKVIAGAALIYPTTQAPLQPGEMVCDRSGNTGVIGSNGLVDPSSVARTRARTPWEYHTSTWFQQRGGK
jgi:hypothetical protein